MAFVTHNLIIQTAGENMLVKKLIGEDMIGSVRCQDYSKEVPEIDCFGYFSSAWPRILEGQYAYLGEGYHSFPINSEWGNAIFEIPKGSRYAISELDGNIISERIKFKNFII